MVRFRISRISVVLIVNCAAFITALVYNGVNSTFDALRGKHDIFGSMAAGGVTGGLYKSTGTLQCHNMIVAFLLIIFMCSWSETSIGSSDLRFWAGRSLELHQEEHIILFTYTHVDNIAIIRPCQGFTPTQT